MAVDQRHNMVIQRRSDGGSRTYSGTAIVVSIIALAIAVLDLQLQQDSIDSNASLDYYHYTASVSWWVVPPEHPGNPLKTSPVLQIENRSSLVAADVIAFSVPAGHDYAYREAETDDDDTVSKIDVDTARFLRIGIVPPCRLLTLPTAEIGLSASYLYFTLDGESIFIDKAGRLTRAGYRETSFLGTSLGDLRKVKAIEENLTNCG
ncbi:hypothetical protein [Actinoplanes sp. N902-109]|uniref:hypothetical protein n=1 Tax=Actinoplanes sp. (strain N902-109) TaxID=649831 RepID=UPI0003295E98|nr:hypothetical protein [Actinoplanes sp. N902-109]AGL18527.1 hypothetical protein L083_5017 [Actinoplanes sp. N902-109]